MFSSFTLLRIDALGVAGVASADDPDDEAAIGGQIGRIGGAVRQQGIPDGALEMTVCGVDGAASIFPDMAIRIAKCG